MSARTWAIGLFLFTLAVSLITVLTGQDRGYTLAIGRFGAADEELSMCTFSIGAATLHLHPKGEPCLLARDLIGHTGRLVFLVDPPPPPDNKEN